MSDIVKGILGKNVVIECNASVYDGWKGKIVSFCGSDGSNGSEAGVNVTVDAIDPVAGVHERLSFDPSVVRFIED